MSIIQVVQGVKTFMIVSQRCTGNVVAPIGNKSKREKKINEQNKWKSTWLFNLLPQIKRMGRNGSNPTLMKCFITPTSDSFQASRVQPCFYHNARHKNSIHYRKKNNVEDKTQSCLTFNGTSIKFAI